MTKAPSDTGGAFVMVKNDSGPSVTDQTCPHAAQTGKGFPLSAFFRRRHAFPRKSLLKTHPSAATSCPGSHGCMSLPAARNAGNILSNPPRFPENGRGFPYSPSRLRA